MNKTIKFSILSLFALAGLGSFLTNFAINKTNQKAKAETIISNPVCYNYDFESLNVNDGWSTINTYSELMIGFDSADAIVVNQSFGGVTSKAVKLSPRGASSGSVRNVVFGGWEASSTNFKGLLPNETYRFSMKLAINYSGNERFLLTYLNNGSDYAEIYIDSNGNVSQSIALNAKYNKTTNEFSFDYPSGPLPHNNKINFWSNTSSGNWVDGHYYVIDDIKFTYNPSKKVYYAETFDNIADGADAFTLQNKSNFKFTEGYHSRYGQVINHSFSNSTVRLQPNFTDYNDIAFYGPLDRLAPEKNYQLEVYLDSYQAPDPNLYIEYQGDDGSSFSWQGIVLTKENNKVVVHKESGPCCIGTISYVDCKLKMVFKTGKTPSKEQFKFTVYPHNNLNDIYYIDNFIITDIDNGNILDLNYSSFANVNLNPTEGPNDDHVYYERGTDFPGSTAYINGGKLYFSYANSSSSTIFPTYYLNYLDIPLNTPVNVTFNLANINCDKILVFAPEGSTENDAIAIDFINKICTLNSSGRASGRYSGVSYDFSTNTLKFNYYFTSDNIGGVALRYGEQIKFVIPTEGNRTESFAISSLNINRNVNAGYINFINYTNHFFRDVCYACDPSGVINNVDVSKWNALASEWNALSNENKKLITDASPYHYGSDSEVILYYYDYVINKYGSSKYQNYMNRSFTSSGGKSLILPSISSEETLSYTAVYVTLAALTSIVVAVLIKKRKGGKLKNK